MEGKDVYVGFEFVTDCIQYSFANIGGEQKVCTVTHIVNNQIFWDIEGHDSEESGNYYHTEDFAYDDCIDIRSFGGWFRSVEGEEYHRIPDWEI